MRLALLQTAPRMLEPRANLESALGLMEPLAAELYLLPELCFSGYTFARKEEVAATAEPAGAGEVFTALAAFARRRNAYVCWGFPERAGERFFNSASLVGPGGPIGTYRKAHLFSRETLFFAPGDAAAPVFDLPFGRVGLMICFDWYFPEMARSLALRGAELLLHPANLVLPHCPQAMITRSLENRMFSATCDRVGTETNGDVTHRFIGSSQVVTPRGEILVRLGREQEEATVVEFDLAAARSKRLGEYNDLFADRKPVLYG